MVYKKKGLTIVEEIWRQRFTHPHSLVVRENLNPGLVRPEAGKPKVFLESLPLNRPKKMDNSAC